MGVDEPAPTSAKPNTTARLRRADRQRRAVVSVVVLALLLATFVLVTAQTGFPGPGPLRRYPISELQALADQINHTDCHGDGPWPEPGASVDWLSSRVRLAHGESAVIAAGDRGKILGATWAWVTPPESAAACPSHDALG